MISRRDLRTIKKCPFCGQEAYVGDNWDGQLAVICCFCGCRTMYYKTRDEAVKIWNTRELTETSKSNPKKSRNPESES